MKEMICLVRYDLVGDRQDDAEDVRLLISRVQEVASLLRCRITPAFRHLSRKCPQRQKLLIGNGTVVADGVGYSAGTLLMLSATKL